MTKKKGSRTHWIQDWIRGGIGSIDQRITDLRNELVQLEAVRKALDPVVAVVADPKMEPQKIKRTKRPARTTPHASLGGFTERVYEALTHTPVKVSDLAEKLRRKSDALYAPLHRLRKAKKAEWMRENNGPQMWRRIE